MNRMFKVALGIVATLALLLGAGPVGASSGADFGACVAAHGATDGGFTGEHNPGMHQGFAGWSECEDH